MTESAPRRWRAACTQCGAPVEFQSAASPLAVCSFCRSTLVREGEVLRRIGQSAELFEDHSPLQLGTAGTWQGVGFTLVGRLQMRWSGGAWNEWHAFFDNGRSGWLSEDNGQYVIGFDVPVPRDVPDPASLQPGARVAVGGRAWTVASVTAVKVGAAQGELPHLPPLERGWVLAELRNTEGEVASLDRAHGPDGEPGWSVGRGVALRELALTNLREGEALDGAVAGKGLECPNCGASLRLTLQSTKSVVCGECHSVVDVSDRGGADLAHYAQENGSEPLIPLGRVGTLSLGPAGTPARAWQVVGYAERCEIASDDEDEATFWREYLVWHREEGFAFLVDAEDGWSWTRPLPGVPQDLGGGRVAVDGVTYRFKWQYDSRVTYVLGEFYWRLVRDQRTRHADYEGSADGGRRHLNREQVEGEVTWSAGAALEADVLVKAFKLPPEARAAMLRDGRPLGGALGSLGDALRAASAAKDPALAAKVAGHSFAAAAASAQRWAITIFVIVVVLMLVAMCSSSREERCEPTLKAFGADSPEYRQCLQRSRSGGSSGGGSSYGGWSSGGGGHK